MICKMSELSAERFERKLSEEISGLRLEFHDSLAAQRDQLRREMHDGFTGLRQEIHAGDDTSDRRWPLGLPACGRKSRPRERN